MKKISIDQIISVTKKQPFTARSLEFLQNALDEDKAAIVKAMITQNLGSYSLTTGYIISGCVLSNSDKDITVGEIFYGGKFYETTAVSGTTNPACLVLTKTQDATADSITFTNGDIGNVHDIYKFVATDATVSTHLGVTDILGTALVSVYGTKTATEYANASQADSSGVYVDMTTLTHTTTKTAKYKVTLYANPKSVKTATALPPLDEQIGAKFRIYNATDTSVIDEKTVETRIKWDSAGALASTLDVTGQWSVVCSRILTINSGKTIKCQFHTKNGTTTTTNNYFTIEEI